MSFKETTYQTEPDESFVRDSLQQLKKGNQCYAYEEWQVKTITELAKERFNLDVVSEFINWYYILKIK